MTHFERLLRAAEILESMAAAVPKHALLEISAEAMADRVAKEVLLDKAHELRLMASEASGLPTDDTA